MISKGFSQAFLDELISKNDIVSVISKYVTLTRRGANFWACCPFHMEKTPSMSVKEDGQFFKCFGCGVGGNVINFVKQIENVDFYKAVEILAENAGMQMPTYEDDQEMQKKKRQRDIMLSILKATSDFYISNLSKVEANKHIDYIRNRGISDAMVKKFKIGASLNYNDLVKHLLSLGFKYEDMLQAGVIADNDRGGYYDFYGTRLIFPIMNGLGEIVGFSGRDLNPSPDRTKYKNTPQTLVFNKSQLIYGYNFLRELKRAKMLDTIVLVEGQMDVIACHQAGVESAIGVMGTALTPSHARDLAYLCKNIILCLDGDGAGSTATYKAINILKEANMNVSVVRLDKAKDPDEYIKKFGVQEFVDELFNARDCIEFILIDLANKYDLTKNADKNKYINEALEYLSKLSTVSEQEIYLAVLKEIVKVPVDALRSTLRGAKEPVRSSSTQVEEVELKANAFEPIAKQCILASLLYNKVGLNSDYDELFNEGGEYSEIYNYITDKLKSGENINISTIYSSFDIEADSVWDKVINYNFPNDEVLNNYIKDAVVRLKVNKLKVNKQTLKQKISQTNDIEQKYKYLAEMNELDKQISSLEKDER